MRKLLLALLLITPLEVGGQSKATSLPPAAKSLLNRTFPGWKFAEASEEIRAFLRERVSTNVHPEIVTGDFDGNGKTDYAVLTKHGVMDELRLPV